MLRHAHVNDVYSVSNGSSICLESWYNFPFHWHYQYHVGMQCSGRAHDQKVTGSNSSRRFSSPELIFCADSCIDIHSTPVLSQQH